MTRIAAIVVTYNSAGEIGPCLDALEGRAEVLVVDNASSDGTLERVAARPWVRVIANSRNRGFAAAVNQGAHASSESMLLLLNPDACLETDITALTKACEEHGMAAGKLLGQDGLVQTGFNIRRFPTAAALGFESLGLNRVWPGNPVNRRYRYFDRDAEAEGLVEQPAGAFLMVSRDIFNRLDGFDEGFAPVWFEDVDFAKRAANLGFLTWYVPQVSARHGGGHSVKRMPAEYKTLVWYVSLLRYAAKHFSTMQFRAVCASVAAGCFFRLVAGKLGKRTSSSAYLQLIGWAGSSLLAGRVCSDRFPFENPVGEAKVRAASHSAQ